MGTLYPLDRHACICTFSDIHQLTRKLWLHCCSSLQWNSDMTQPANHQVRQPGRVTIQLYIHSGRQSDIVKTSLNLYYRIWSGFTRLQQTDSHAESQTGRQTDRHRALQADTDATFRLILLSITTYSLVIPASVVNLQQLLSMQGCKSISYFSQSHQTAFSPVPLSAPTHCMYRLIYPLHSKSEVYLQNERKIVSMAML